MNQAFGNDIDVRLTGKAAVFKGACLCPAEHVCPKLPVGGSGSHSDRHSLGGPTEATWPGTCGLDSQPSGTALRSTCNRGLNGTLTSHVGKEDTDYRRFFSGPGKK